MPNEVKENNRVPVDDVLAHILDMMKHMVSDPNGVVPESYAGAFDSAFADTDGNPMAQTLGGLVMVLPEALEKGQIYFSPNLGVDHEGLCVEVCNLSKYLATAGYELVVCNAHYIDFEGVISYGQKAREVRDHIEQTILLQKIKSMQDNLDSTKPRLILPDNKLITR